MGVAGERRWSRPRCRCLRLRGFHRAIRRAGSGRVHANSGRVHRGSLYESALSVRHLEQWENSRCQKRLPLLQRAERAGRRQLGGAPHVIACQPDVLPAERGHVPQQVLVDRPALAPQIGIGNVEIFRVTGPALASPCSTTCGGIVTLASFTCQWRDALMGRTQRNQ